MQEFFFSLSYKIVQRAKTMPGRSYFEKFKEGVDPFTAENRLKWIRSLPAETSKKLEHAMGSQVSHLQSDILHLKALKKYVSSTGDVAGIQQYMENWKGQRMPLPKTTEYDEKTIAEKFLKQMINEEQAKLTGYGMMKAHMEREVIENSANLEFLTDFWKWLNGQGTESDTSKTRWGRVPIRFPDVIAYMDSFVDLRYKFLEMLVM